MRLRNTILAWCGLGFIAAVAVSACGGDDVNCTAGMMRVGETCEPTGGGSGTSTNNGGSSSMGTAGGNAGGGGSSAGGGTNAGGGGSGGGTTSGAPMFAGVKSVSPASDTSLLLTWDPGSDSQTPVAQLKYDVYVSTTAGGETFDTPTATTSAGATTFVVDTLTTGTKYFVVVRALDGDGNQDDNKIELSGTPAADTTPPTFAGPVAATAAPGGKVHVTWAAASDTQTATDAIIYRVWSSTTTPVDTTGAPTLTTAGGALSADVVEPVPMTTYYFRVHAVDAAGNVDTNTAEVSSAPGADTLAPTFSGCATATAVDSATIALTWNAATDDTTPADQITYAVYGFVTPGPHTDVSTADATQTFGNTLTGNLGGLLADTKYYLVCRATDLSGNQDTNDHEKTATTDADTTPPTFNGASSINLGAPSTTQIVISWGAATDAGTPTANIKYDVFQASASGMENLTGTPTVTVTGVTQATVSVAPRTLAYFVVRARDAAGNSDSNANEVSITTDTSFNTDVQPILSSICTNCHTVNIASPNLPTMDPGFARANLIAGGPSGPEVISGDAPDSRIIQYISYTPPSCPFMPYMLCGDALSQGQIQTIYDWITQGIQDN